MKKKETTKMKKPTAREIENKSIQVLFLYSFSYSSGLSYKRNHYIEKLLKYCAIIG